MQPRVPAINRSIQVFQDCINSFPEVEELISEVTSRLDRFDRLRTRDSKPATLRTLSLTKRTDVISVQQELAERKRQSKRMSVTPGPGQYFCKPVTAHRPEARMEGRPRDEISSSPGPAVYAVQQAADIKYGFWPREPRYKQVTQKDHLLGPGSYDVPSFIDIGSHSTNIDAGSISGSASIGPQSMLGPGQYSPRDTRVVRGYTIPSSKRNDKHATNLGPGKYDAIPLAPQSAFKFSTSPRFSSSFTEKIQSFSMSNPFTRNEVSFVQTGFREKIEDYRPKRRKEIQEQAAMLRDLKIEAARKTQRALFEQKKLLKETSLKLKFQKFEWRQNKAEIRAMKKGWTWLVCAFGCVHVIGSRLEARKDLRRRTNSKLSFFYFAARFMGKLLMIRHIKRAKRAFVVLRRLRLPLKRKIAKIREKQKLIVVESVESYCTANLMHKLMEKWRSSILCIQRGLRPLLIARRQLYKKLIKDWSVVENDLFLRRNKANKKKKKYTSVPELVREYLIREYLKGKFRKFIHERNAAMETMEEYSKEYYNTRTEAVILGKSSVLLEAAAAMLPVLDLTISEETYLKFINVAEVNRLMWGKLSQKRIASPLFQMTNLDLEEPSVPVFNEARPRERRIALIPHMVD